jgi:hypothetical protein
MIAEDRPVDDALFFRAVLPFGILHEICLQLNNIGDSESRIDIN